MNNSNTKKSHKRLLTVLSLVIFTAGSVFVFTMSRKSQEERRNREYEVSLVNALKNSVSLRLSLTQGQVLMGLVLATFFLF